MRPPLRTLAAAGALGLAASAPAMGAWGPPQRASTGPGDAGSPDVAVNEHGDAAAIWVQETGGRGRIVASVRRAAGPWSRPAPVSPAGLAAIDPRVAIDASGRAVAVWRQVVRTRVLQGRRQAVYVARSRERRPGGGWGAVATLSDDRQKVGTPELAMDGRGVAIATWHWGTGTRAGTPGHIGEVQVAEKRPGGAWSRSRRASGRTGCALDTRLPQTAAGAGGHAVVWWQCDQAGGRAAFDAIGRGPSPGAWSAPRRLPVRIAREQAVDLAVAPDGTVLGLSVVPARPPVAWRGPSPLGRADSLGLTQLTVLLPPLAARHGGRPAVATASAAALAAWISDSGLALVDPVLDNARVTAVDGPLRARSDVRVAASAIGSAVAVARSGGGVVATNRAAGGEWAALERISAAGAAEDAGVGIDATGAAVAYWARRAGGRSVVERAELAATP
jgi:hypothetical protein